MKLKFYALLSATALAAMGESLPAVAASASGVQFEKQLQVIASPEIPAQAASAVALAPADQRQAVAIEIVTAAIAKAPAMTPEIVGAVVRKSPDTAAPVAAQAAALQQKQAPAVARSAAAAAPERASAILGAICKKVPGAYQQVCVAVASAAPKSTDKLLTSLVQAIPTLEPFVKRATQMAGAADDSMPVVMNYTAALVQQAASSLKRTTTEIVALGITSQQEASLEAQFASVAEGQGIRFVPGGGKPGEEHRNKVIVVEKGSGRDKDYSLP